MYIIIIISSIIIIDATLALALKRKGNYGNIIWILHIRLALHLHIRFFFLLMNAFEALLLTTTYIFAFIPSDPVIGNDSTTLDAELPGDAEKLRELRDHVAMELLWTEQAIQSRKKVSFWYDLRTLCFANLYQH